MRQRKTLPHKRPLRAYTPLPDRTPPHTTAHRRYLLRRCCTCTLRTTMQENRPLMYRPGANGLAPSQPRLIRPVPRRSPQGLQCDTTASGQYERPGPGRNPTHLPTRARSKTEMLPLSWHHPEVVFAGLTQGQVEHYCILPMHYFSSFALRACFR